MHKTTPEVIADVKASLAARDKAAGREPRDVYLSSFQDGEVEFLYTYILHGDFSKITSSPSYRKALEGDPEVARKYLNTRVLEETVLWPPEFSVAMPEEAQPYAAGVIPGLLNDIEAASGFRGTVSPPQLVGESDPTVITEDDIAAAKASDPMAMQYGVWEQSFGAFTFDTAANDFRFVPLRKYLIVPCSHAKYRDALRIGGQDAGLISLEIAKKCVLFPKDIDWDNEASGVAIQIAEAIMGISGFDENARAKPVRV